MSVLRSRLTLAAASAALGFAVLAASPAAAFDPIYDGWNSHNSRNYSSGPGYGYSSYGRGYPGYDVDTSEIAICPPGYSLGPDARLCWPN